MADRTRALTPADHEELVAFLANETDPAATERVQARLDLDPAARREKDLLEASWKALDFLPRPAPKPGFQERTASLAATAAAEPDPRTWSGWWRWPAALLGGLGLGFGLARSVPDPHRQTLNDLPLLAEWPALKAGGDPAFAKLLIAAKPFAPTVPPPPVGTELAAAAGLAQSQRRDALVAAEDLAALPAEQQRALRSLAADLRALPPPAQAEARGQLHALADFLAGQPDRQVAEWAKGAPEERLRQLTAWRTTADAGLAAARKEAEKVSEQVAVGLEPPAIRAADLARRQFLKKNPEFEAVVNGLDKNKRATLDTLVFLAALANTFPPDRPGAFRNLPAMMPRVAAALADCPEFAEAFPLIKNFVPERPTRLAEILVQLYRLPVAPNLPAKDWQGFAFDPPEGPPMPAAPWPAGKLPPELAKRLASYRAYRANPAAAPAAAKEPLERLARPAHVQGDGKAPVRPKEMFKKKNAKP